MHRPQFSIGTLLWLTLVVAAFLRGIAFEKGRARRAKPTPQAVAISLSGSRC